MCQGRLRDDVAPVDAFVLDDADVRFFAKKNPGHAQGDELCCLGKINLGFFRTVARKYLVPWTRTRRSPGRSRRRAKKITRKRPDGAPLASKLVLAP